MEIVKNLEELRKNAEDAARNFNKSVEANIFTEIASAREAVNDAIAAYNDESKSVAFAALWAEENAMFAALVNPYYRVLKTKQKDNVVEIDTGEALIDIIELESLAPRQISHNGQWKFWVEKFTKLLAARVVSEVGTDDDKKKFASLYRITKAAEGCDLGATPTSNTQTVKALQTIVDAIIFSDNGKGLNSYKVTTKDVAYMEFLMCRNGSGRLSIAVPRIQTIVKLITIVCNRIVTNGKYSVEFETKKAKAVKVA